MAKKNKSKSGKNKAAAPAKRRPNLTQSPHYDYVPIIDRPKFRLPKGARVAVIAYINIEHFPHDVPGTAIIPGTQRFNPDPLNYGWRDYGNRVGLWRLFDVLDRHRLRCTASLNLAVLDMYPQIHEAMGRHVLAGELVGFNLHPIDLGSREPVGRNDPSDVAAVFTETLQLVSASNCVTQS